MYAGHVAASPTESETETVRQVERLFAVDVFTPDGYMPFDFADDEKAAKSVYGILKAASGQQHQ